MRLIVLMFDAVLLTRDSVVRYSCRVTDDNDLYWLAGLLEGEGAFLHGPPSSPSVPMIRLVMTDLDVVDRVAAMIGRTVQRNTQRSPHHKPSFSTSVKGASAVHFMRLLRPSLGARRQAQIDAALTDVPDRQVRWLRSAAACTTAGCLRIALRRALCRQHYDSWWRARKRGRISPHIPRVPELPEAILEVPVRGHPHAISWLAGLLEGEGSFSNSDGYPVISVSMCDQDVIARTVEILNCQTIRDATDARDRVRGWAPVWSAALAGARAADLMRGLRPLMYSRRRLQIDRALAAYHPIRLTAPPEICVTDGCERPHRSRGLCNTHYMKWSRDRAHGREARVTSLR